MPKPTTPPDEVARLRYQYTRDGVLRHSYRFYFERHGDCWYVLSAGAEEISAQGRSQSSESTILRDMGQRAIRAVYKEVPGTFEELAQRMLYDYLMEPGVHRA